MIDRRAVIKGGLLAGAAAAWGVRADGAASTPGMRRIATEEGFNIPEVARATARVLPGIVAREPGEAAIFGVDRPRSGDEGPPPWLHQLSDIGAGRIADMDSAGIAMQVLLLSSPGVQLFEAGEARDLSRLANDRLADGDSQVIPIASRGSRPFPRRIPPSPRGSWNGRSRASD